MPALTFFPKTRLSELVGRLGGLTRDDAVEAAKTQLESLRGEADSVIGVSLGQLETVIYAPETPKTYSQAQLNDILALGDQIVTLAGTFGHQALDKAIRSLCDVADGLLRTKKQDVPSIQVHMRTIRMLAPGAPALSAEQTELVLSELAKILAHHGFKSLGDGAPQEPSA